MKILFEYLLMFPLHWFLMLRGFYILNGKEIYAKRNIQFRIIPGHQRTHDKVIVCMIGLSGSGKSSVAQLIAEKTAGLVINADAIRVALRHQGASYDKHHVIAQDLIREYINTNHRIILDSDFSEWTKRAVIRHLAMQVGARVVFIQTHCDDQVAIGRILRDDYTHPRNEFFQGASCDWKGENHGMVMKLSERVRNMPRNYDFTKTILGGGSWKLRTFACVDHVVDTTMENEWRAQAEKIAELLVK